MIFNVAYAENGINKNKQFDTFDEADDFVKTNGLTDAEIEAQ